MYLPIWIILTIVVIVFLMFKNKKPISAEEKLERTWTVANIYRNNVKEKSPLIDKYLGDERDLIDAMELDVLRMRERNKQDTNMRQQITQDWFDFAKALSNIKSSRELLDVDMHEGAHERHELRTKESYITVQEIIKRIGGELGKESQSLMVLEKIQKKSVSIKNIYEDLGEDK